MKLIGLARLGQDAVVRNVGDTCVANLSLAFNYGKKDDQGKRPTQWVEGALWGNRADSLEPYLVKGQSFLVELDDVHIETYEKRDNGGTGTKLTGNVRDIEFAGPPPQQNDDGGNQQRQGNQQRSSGNGQRQQPAARQAPPPARSAGQRSNQGRTNAPAQAPRASSGFDDMDDDIPF